MHFFSDHEVSIVIIPIVSTSSDINASIIIKQVIKIIETDTIGKSYKFIPTI